jgi:hypothetical protein
MTSPLVLLAMEAVKGRGGRDGIGESTPLLLILPLTSPFLSLVWGPNPFTNSYLTFDLSISLRHLIAASLTNHHLGCPS